MQEQTLTMSAMKSKRLKTLKWLNSRVYPPIPIRNLEKLVYSLIIYYVLQSIYLIAVFWAIEVFDMRVRFLENLAYSLSILGIFTDLYFNMGSGSPSAQAMDMDYFIHYESDSNDDVLKKVKFIESGEEICCKEIQIVKYLFYMTGFCISLIHIRNTLLLLTGKKEYHELIYTHLVLNPLNSMYIPTDIPSYIAMVALQTLILYTVCIGAVMVYTNLRFILKAITDEISLFMMSLEKLNYLISSEKSSSIMSKELHYKASNDDVSRKYENGRMSNSLMKTIRTLCIHHQRIFKYVARKHALVTKASRLRIAYSNTSICLHLAISFFCLEKGDLAAKCRYGIFSVALLLFCFIYSDNGQKVTDKFEEMHDAFYKCLWYELPTDARKSLLLILIRNTKIPIISVFDIIRMDRVNFIKVVQAIYSYFNLLRRGH